MNLPCARPYSPTHCKIANRFTTNADAAAISLDARTKTKTINRNPSRFANRIRRTYGGDGVCSQNSLFAIRLSTKTFAFFEKLINLSRKIIQFNFSWSGTAATQAARHPANRIPYASIEHDNDCQTAIPLSTMLRSLSPSLSLERRANARVIVCANVDAPVRPT